MGKQNVGDLNLIQQNLQNWLGAQLGHTEDFRLSELNFPEASGESSVTLLFDAYWSEKGNAENEKFVLRMVPQESEVFESHDLKLQYDLMDIMKREGVPVPGLIAYEADASLLGSDFYVMEFVDGLIPPDQPPMAFGSWVSELSTEDRAKMWNSGFTTMAKIHSVDVNKYDLPTIPQSKPDEAPAAHEMLKYQRLLELGLRDCADPIIHTCWKLLQETLPKNGSRRLCWGDSRPGNIIFKDLKPAAIVDWELATIGDPQTDIAWYFWIDHVNSVGLGTDKMSGIPDFDAAYQQWSELTGLPIDDVAWYELFVLWRFTVIMEKKFIAAAKTDSNFLEFPNYAAAMLPTLMKKLESDS